MLLSKDPNDLRIKIIDFGISKANVFEGDEMK